MKPKQIIVLSVIFGILALGILLKTWVRSASDNVGSARGGLVAFAEFDPVKLERILIRHGKQAPVELAKENGVWKVKSLWNAKADDAKVEKLIQKLRSARGELRGSGKKLFADFGIQDTEALSIRLLGLGNAVLSDFRIGTKQAGENGYFFRQAASEDIYFADVNMPDLLGVFTTLNEADLSSLFWADLSLFDLDPEKVTRITLYRLNGEEKTMTAGLERAADPKDPLKSSWKFLRKDLSSTLDPDKVLKFIAVMNSVRADKIVDPAGKGYGLEKPVWQLAVSEGGRKTLLNAGSKDEKQKIVYVKRSGDPAVFELKTSFFSDLNVDDTYFVKDAPPAAGAKKNPSPEINPGLLEGQEPAA